MVQQEEPSSPSLLGEQYVTFSGPNDSTPLDQDLQRLLLRARSPRHDDQETALQELATLDSEQRFALLLRLSQDELPWARELAIDLLPGELEGHAARSALLLERLREATAAGEAQALILILREQAELPLDEELLRLAEHEEPDLRYQALAALELRANDSEAFRLLLRRALEDKDDELASVSAQGLARLSERSALSALRARRAHAAVGLRLHFDLARARLGDDVSAELLEALSDTSTRFAALLAIAEFRVKAALPLCAKLSRSWFGDPFVRVAAAYAQACLGDADGCQHLYRWAEGRSDWNTYAAERLLALLLEEAAEVDTTRLQRIFEGWLFGGSERLASSAVDNLQRWASSSALALLERASQSNGLCDASVAELVRAALTSLNTGAAQSTAAEGHASSGPSEGVRSQEGERRCEASPKGARQGRQATMGAVESSVPESERRR